MGHTSDCLSIALATCSVSHNEQYVSHFVRKDMPMFHVFRTTAPGLMWPWHLIARV